MKIDTSHINLSSSHFFTQTDEVKIETSMSFSNLFKDRLGQYQPQAEEGASVVKAGSMSFQWYEISSSGGLGTISLTDQFMHELNMMRDILDRILDRLKHGGRDCSLELTALDGININSRLGQAAQVVEYERIEKRYFSHFEREDTGFAADGVVTTKDGRSIDFTFGMNLSREFFREDQFEYRETGYYLIDPLIINLDSDIPRLAEAEFSFDLDMDGVEEDLPMLAPGSGFLVLDKNNDGIINDGSELFGPSTGHGFLELSEYDDDQNFWIDEGDEIFDDLTIWESDEEGEMHLTRLKDAGVGAIYLASADTPFDLRDEDNQLQARVKRSGIILNEDGTAGSIQEIDYTA